MTTKRMGIREFIGGSLIVERQVLPQLAAPLSTELRSGFFVYSGAVTEMFLDEAQRRCRAFVPSQAISGQIA
jgi:hypothetical protein